MVPAPSVADERAPSPADRLAELLKPLSNAKRLALLQHLREPRYLEEIASFLGVTRQAASEHVEALQSIGLLERRASERPGKRVIEFVLATEALFEAHEYFEELVVQVTPWVEAGDTRQPAARTPSPAPATLAAPVLTVVHGIQLGRQYPIVFQPSRPAWVIGRAAESDARVPHDSYMSSRHAEVRRGAAPGELVLVDVYSRNGTLMNWRPVPPGEPRKLKHGDLVGVGRTLLLFWDGN